jgi:murein DD-endopeptidase MepM/ murein hydrolase activator NlpD
MPNNLTPAWTLIIVPPTATASPRRVGVKKRTVRLAVLLASIAVAVPWLWTFAASESAGQMADSLAAEQRLSAALSDTVESLRVASLAAVAAKLPPADMLLPVAGEITSRFSRSRFHPILQIFRAHRGVDLAAPSGTRIHAPAVGKVVSVERRLGFGLTIEIAHTGGVVTRYAHCQLALVRLGDSVVVGQAIGAVGQSGLATAPHLHFELLVNGVARDPIQFIASTHRTSPVPAAGGVETNARNERAEHHE